MVAASVSFPMTTAAEATVVNNCFVMRSVTISVGVINSAEAVDPNVVAPVDVTLDIVVSDVFRGIFVVAISCAVV